MSDDPSDLTLDVWQFVRLMVQMEETLNGSGSAQGGGSGLKALYDLWEDLWVDLDAQLLDLGKRDPETFADMMMEQEVVLENPPAGARALAADELAKVVDALKRQLTRTDDPLQVEDLSFERDELSETIRTLRGFKGVPGAARAAGSTAAPQGAVRRQPRDKGSSGKGSGGKKGPGAKPPRR
jgi:hypothetical protein